MLGLVSLGSRVGDRDIGEACPQISHLLSVCLGLPFKLLYVALMSSVLH